MNMYILWILYGIFLGAYFRTYSADEKRLMGKGFKIRKEQFSYYLYAGGIKISLTFLGASLCFFLAIGFINDLTYASWIGSILGFLGLLMLVLLASLFIEASYFSHQGQPVSRRSPGSTTDFTSSTTTFGIDLSNLSSNPGPFMALPIVGFILIILTAVTGSLIPIAILFCGIPIFIAVFILIAAAKVGEDEFRNSIGTGRDLMGLGRDNIPLSRLIKAGGTLLVFLLLILSNITPYTGNLDFNPTFEQLNDTQDNTGDAEMYLTNYNDIRVISWDLATDYLQRAYSDAASTLSTDQVVLSLNTDPDYVNGKFVWVNAPQYEFLKWTGGKEVPFYVHVVNDPQNMTKDGFEAVQRSNQSLSVHRDKISWGKRIDQVLHDEYAGELVNIQVRINLDEDLHPYWVVYLGKRHVMFDVVTLEKILIIDAADMDRTWEYDIDDPDIPDWLEVVYPDNYLLDWAKLWGSWREGISYRFFTKRHLSYPDDTPRFLILNGTPFWYLPMRQLDSPVFAGYILMNTRTGETVYHNREAKSLADKHTATTQVSTYLSSGAQGFRQLQTHEGYLYPIRVDSGQVREAYIFPLYSGFTIQQYAIVDAQFYTQSPFFGNDVESLLDEYRSHVFEIDQNVTHTWITLEMDSAYADEEEGAFTSNGTTYIVSRSDLPDGSISESDNEWREFRLAVSDLDRGDEVAIDVVVAGQRVIDVDYGGSDLVTH